MNRLTRAMAMLMVAAGITLGAGSTPAIAAVTSGGHPAVPRVFHCC